MKVCFCGHREVIDTKVETRLRLIIEQLITDGADTFLLGGYGEFDRLSAHIVCDLKKKYTYIKSILVIPYIHQSYDPDLYDYSIFPPLEHTPPKFAISKRNRYMVEESDVVVAYVNKNYGGAYQTLEYGRKKKKKIISVLP
ncbi:MAG: hypothetical protein IKB50_00840 [Clostridia bacterium]|nr:hypothetical protein [Clostridia bacterium]